MNFRNNKENLNTSNRCKKIVAAIESRYISQRVGEPHENKYLKSNRAKSSMQKGDYSLQLDNFNSIMGWLDKWEFVPTFAVLSIAVHTVITLEKPTAA